jgi:hypothetical protein
VIPWERAGETVMTKVDRQESAVLRGLVQQMDEMLRSRIDEAPQDELATLTGMRTGPSTAPEDPILSRLLPDFHRLDDEDTSKRTGTPPPRCGRCTSLSCWTSRPGWPACCSTPARLAAAW